MEAAATRRLGSPDPADKDAAGAGADDDGGKIKRTKIDREDAVEGNDDDDLDREFEVSLDYGDEEEEGEGSDRRAKRGGRKAGRRRYRRKGKANICVYWI